MYVSCYASSPNDSWLIRCNVGQIEVLPDDVLLEIFDFCVVGYQDIFRSGDDPDIVLRDDDARKVEWWQPLVHVCRRWRVLVFGSPRRLNLRHYCRLGSVTRKTLDFWPSLPLLIMRNANISDELEVMDKLTCALEYSNRICQICLDFRTLTTSQIGKVWTAMQVPFPELTALILDSESGSMTRSETMPVVPDSFLGGSAPRLRHLTLLGIPFPGMQKLLLSTIHLVELHLLYIPHSGYISPEEMVTCLSALTSLERLSLGFKSPLSSSDQESRKYAPPPPTRSVLPTLMALLFRNDNEYLENLLARIDAPRLYRLWITSFNDIDFDTPQLIQFIGRTLTFKPPHEVHVALKYNDRVLFQLQSQASDLEMVELYISCIEPDWQLSALAHISTLFSSLLSAAESLYIYEDLNSFSKLDRKDGIENNEWLEFLFPFTAVKNLYIAGPGIALALQELTEGRMTAVLPTLQNLFLEGFRPSESIQEGIGHFISGRQLANHPITISSWYRDEEQDRLLGR
jgi:hypothetical protein